MTTAHTFKPTPEQKAFYDTFGFLALRNLFSAVEFGVIERAFEQVIGEAMKEQGAVRDRLDRRFVIDPGFCERHSDLRAVVEDNRIGQMLDLLLGPDWFYQGSDGSLYVGDTHWHPDSGWSTQRPGGRSDPGLEPSDYYPGIKVALYLDPVTEDAGCLRVIPGSQISPFHESLAMLHCDIPESAPHLHADAHFKQFDLASPDVPSFAVESRPGDIVFFGWQTWHASFGGSSDRRMFAMGFMARPNEHQREWAEAMKSRADRIRQNGGR